MLLWNLKVKGTIVLINEIKELSLYIQKSKVIIKGKL